MIGTQPHRSARRSSARKPETSTVKVAGATLAALSLVLDWLDEVRDADLQIGIGAMEFVRSTTVEK